MKQLKPGEHFGEKKLMLQLKNCVFTEVASLPGMDVPWHYHENAYFFYQLNGSLSEINKKETLNSIPGTILFHYWQEPHYNKNVSVDSRYFHIDLNQDWFAQHALDPKLLEGFKQLSSQRFRSLFNHLYKETLLNDATTPLAAEGLLLQVFAEILRTKPSTAQPPQWVKVVRHTIHDTWQEKITLGGLAREAGIHPVYLSQEFPRYFHASLGDYIRLIKVEKSAELLADPTISLSEIAYRCGFSDQSHFIRCFKKINGFTPSDFRKNFFGA